MKYLVITLLLSSCSNMNYYNEDELIHCQALENEVYLGQQGIDFPAYCSKYKSHYNPEKK